MRSVGHREILHGVFPSSSSSDTRSGTPSCTKTMGKLAVVISATCDGKIDDMDFYLSRGL
jgi:hypothetical protein